MVTALKERAHKLTDLVLELNRVIGGADINNGEKTDVIAGLLSLHMTRAINACGPQAVPVVLQRFMSRICAMHPNIKGFMVEKNTICRECGKPHDGKHGSLCEACSLASDT